MSNYRKQHELITVIIGEFEAEKETDTDEVKSKRFEKIMDLMQQVGEILFFSPCTKVQKSYKDFVFSPYHHTHTHTHTHTK